MKSLSRAFAPILAFWLGASASQAQDVPIVIGADASKRITICISGFSEEPTSVLRFDLESVGFLFVPEEKAMFTLVGSQNGQLEGRLYNQAKSMVLGRAYKDGPLRERTHALANDIVSAIRQDKGIFLTKIAYRVQHGQQQSEIVIADFDGHAAQKVTHDDSLAVSPCWVPGAFALAYTTYQSGFPEILVHNLKTGDRTVVTAYPGGNYSPAVSPGGRRVAVILSKGGNQDLYVCNIDGSELRQLTHDVHMVSSPCWSPKGDKLCFTMLSGLASLYTIPAEGGDPQRLSTVGAQNATEPDWSPDGTQIAFTSLQGDFHVCVVPAAGGTARLLADGQDPSWAPNSRTIVFTTGQNQHRRLCLLDVPTKTVKDVQQLSGSCSQPSWAR
jgi:TolB protein